MIIKSKESSSIEREGLTYQEWRLDIQYSNTCLDNTDHNGQQNELSKTKICIILLALCHTRDNVIQFNNRHLKGTKHYGADHNDHQLNDTQHNDIQYDNSLQNDPTHISLYVMTSA